MSNTHGTGSARNVVMARPQWKNQLRNMEYEINGRELTHFWDNNFKSKLGTEEAPASIGVNMDTRGF